MMDFIKKLASGEAGSVAQILFIMGVVNASLMGLSMIIGSFKDKTENKVDDKIYAVLHKCLHYAAVAIDFLSANKAHSKKEGSANDKQSAS